MASVFQRTRITDTYTKIGTAPAVVIWNKHPTLVLRVAMNTAKPDDTALAFHELRPRESIEHAQIPDGAAVYLRADRDGESCDIVWRQLTR